MLCVGQPDSGMTALLVAAKAGNIKAVNYLLEHGAVTTSRDVRDTLFCCDVVFVLDILIWGLFVAELWANVSPLGMFMWF